MDLRTTGRARKEQSQRDRSGWRRLSRNLGGGGGGGGVGWGGVLPGEPGAHLGPWGGSAGVEPAPWGGTVQEDRLEFG